MINLKNNPVGVDKPIQEIAQELYDSLGYSSMEGYGRVDLIERKGKTIPCHFLDGIDYKEIVLKKSDVTYFFLENNKTEVLNRLQSKSNFDVVFLINLKKAEPNITHRADEEVRVKISNILSNYSKEMLKSTTRGGDAIDFDSNLVDMQPYHFIKFSCELVYNINC